MRACLGFFMMKNRKESQWKILIRIRLFWADPDQLHWKSFNSDPVNPYGVRFDMKGRTRIGSILDILVKITILTILLSIKYYNLLSLSYFSILGHMAYIELDFRKTTDIRIGQNIYCHKMFHNSVLHLLKYIFAVY